jgi:hypothetical protein
MSGKDASVWCGQKLKLIVRHTDIFLYLVKLMMQLTTALVRTFTHLGVKPMSHLRVSPGNTNGGSITVPLTSCLTGLDLSVLPTKIVSCHAADSKPVKQEVNGTVILPL